MRRFLVLASALFLASFSSAKDTKSPQGLESKGFYDFSGGIDTYHSSLSLPESYLANGLNIFVGDANAPITKRQGYTVAFSTKAYQYQTLWSYTDPNNNSWILVRSSDQITANQLNGSASVLVATVSVNNLIGETNAFGWAYFVDQTQGVYYWNGTSTTYVTGSPTGSLITTFHQRVWVAGAAVPNGNQLYGSKQNNGSVWTIGVNPNDPVQLSVGLQDNFDNLTALYPFLDTLYLFKHYATYALYGFDQTNFQVSIITQECGCIDQNSIQTFNHGLNFVSLRGIEFFDGYTCTRISDPIKNKVDPAIQAGSFSQQSWVLQAQADWQSGTISNLSTTISPPALLISSFSITENSASSGWSSGSNTNFSVGTSSLSLLINNSGNVDDNSFEDATITDNWTRANTTGIPWDTYTSAAALNNCSSVSPQSGSRFAAVTGATSSPLNPCSSTAEVDLLDANDNLLSSQNITLPTDCSKNSWNQSTFSNPSLIGQRVKLSYKVITTGSTCTPSSGYTLIKSAHPFILGGNITFYANISGQAAGTGEGPFLAIDNIQNGSSTINAGSFTSQIYNTGISSATYQLQVGWTVNTATPTFDLQTASNSITGPWTEILTSTGINAAGQQYAKYTSTISVGSIYSALTSIGSASVIASASTGTFKSPIHTVSSLNSWGNFSITDALNQGNIAFSICSSSNSNMGPPTSCANQTPNSQITVSTGSTTGTYVQWFATFTVTASTQTPTLNSGTVQWFSGNKAIPMASTIWDNRYWLSLTTNTVDTNNDAIVVMNQKRAFTIFDIHAGGLTQYKGALYHSDSLPSGNVYLDNQGYNDNGNAINAFIQTKDYTQGDINSDDYFDSIYVSMDDFGSYNMEISYYMDRLYSSPFSLSTVNQTEFSNNTAVKIPFPISGGNQNFGKTITYLFTANDLGEPWNFYGLTHYYHERPVQ